jgi:hypothetical protein
MTRRDEGALRRRCAPRNDIRSDAQFAGTVGRKSAANSASETADDASLIRPTRWLPSCWQRFGERDAGDFGSSRMRRISSIANSLAFMQLTNF